MLSNAELFQIDLFYRSRKTFVHVCPCPAVLYFCRAAISSSGGGGSSSGWRYAAAGVPVIVVETLRIAVGPRLHVVLAERGTGFELWRYGLPGVQQYAVNETSTTGGDNGGGAAFHTVLLPSGNVAGLCFDDAASAGDFYRQLLRVDELYSAGGGGSRSRKGKKSTTRSDMAPGAIDLFTSSFPRSHFSLTHLMLSRKYLLVCVLFNYSSFFCATFPAGCQIRDCNCMPCLSVCSSVRPVSIRAVNSRKKSCIESPKLVGR